MKKIAIIGAGLAGVSIAHLLKQKADITIFEKSRGVSGRMSTRRAEPYYFDHGAQYFTIRTKEFREFLEPLFMAEKIKKWDSFYIQIDGTKKININQSDQQNRYVGVPAMNEIIKYLAKDFDIKLNVKITELEKKEKWNIKAEDGEIFQNFDWVICTTPAPQALMLVPQSFKYYQEVKNTKMGACYSLMLGFDNEYDLGFETAHVKNSDISWIAINSKKPARQSNFSLLVHSTQDYAEEHIDADRFKVLQYLCAEVSKIIGIDVNKAEHKALHGWRYANNITMDELPVLIDTNLNIALCGDWCAKGRVEGAFISAYNLGIELENFLT